MGLSLRKPLPGGAEIALWRITESENELRRLLSGHNHTINGTRSEALRKEKLAVLALVDCIFDGRFSLGHLDNGKPYLYIYDRPFAGDGAVSSAVPRISVTHTDGWAGVIVSPQYEVGIDIESVGRKFAAVERKSLSDNEIGWLCDDGARLPDDGQISRRNLQLGVIWCAKEAVYKRMGVDVVDFAADMEVDRFEPADEGSLSATLRAGDGRVCTVGLQYIIYSGLVLVWTID